MGVCIYYRLSFIQAVLSVKDEFEDSSESSERSDRRSIARKGIHWKASEPGMCLGCLETAWDQGPVEQGSR